MRIIDRYLIREVAGMASAVTLVLLVILVGARFARYLGPAAAGEMPASAIGRLLVFSTLEYLTVLVPVAIFLAIILAVGRLYRDSEAAAMAACGVGPAAMYRGLLMAAAPSALLLAALAFELAPWAERQTEIVQEAAEQAAVFAMAEPGKFRELGRGRAVFYVERTSPEGRWLQNVFIRIRGDEPVIIKAPKGQQRLEDDGYLSLILYDGYRYEGRPGHANYKIIRFERHGLRYRLPAPQMNLDKRSLQTTAALWANRADPKALAELHWRLSFPVSVLVLTVLALPLARSAPRQRAVGLLLGVLLYVVYSNLLTVGQSWLERGVLAGALGLWWVHLLFIGLAFALLGAQDGWRWLLGAQPRWGVHANH